MGRSALACLFLFVLCTGCGNVDDFVGTWEATGVLRNASENERVRGTITVSEGRSSDLVIEVPLMLGAACNMTADIQGMMARLPKGRTCRFDIDGASSLFTLDDGSFGVGGSSAQLKVTGRNDQYWAGQGWISSPFVVALELRRTR